MVGQPIIIVPKKNGKLKIAFIIDWGAFIWKVMPFGMKNGHPTYQRVVIKTLFVEAQIMFLKV